MSSSERARAMTRPVWSGSAFHRHCDIRYTLRSYGVRTCATFSCALQRGQSAVRKVAIVDARVHVVAHDRSEQSVSSLAMDCILSIDQGTQSTRVFVYDKDAKAVASHQVDLPQILPQARSVPQSPVRMSYACQYCAKERRRHLGCMQLVRTRSAGDHGHCTRVPLPGYSEGAALTRSAVTTKETRHRSGEHALILRHDQLCVSDRRP
jgi:hypothetical protein